MAKGKTRRTEAEKARRRAITDKNKRKRELKTLAEREKWANDKKYLKKQAEKGYEKVNGKWVKAKKGVVE
jgi:hypothetical protein